MQQQNETQKLRCAAYDACKALLQVYVGALNGDVLVDTGKSLSAMIAALETLGEVLALDVADLIVKVQLLNNCKDGYAREDAAKQLLEAMDRLMWQ